MDTTYKLPKGRYALVTDLAALRAYFTPGSKVGAMMEDVVLAFTAGREAWSVTVQGPDGAIRSHRTAPTRKQFEAAMAVRQGR